MHHENTNASTCTGIFKMLFSQMQVFFVLFCFFVFSVVVFVCCCTCSCNVFAVVFSFANFPWKTAVVAFFTDIQFISI